MSRIAFFSHKSGVGNTTLVFHVAHALADQGRRVLLVDLDPQSNLTAMCLSEERLEALWPQEGEHSDTVLGCLGPIVRGHGDIQEPEVQPITERIGLLAGDLGLSGFGGKLSDAWPRALDRDEGAFRTLSAFDRMTTRAREKHSADIVLFDIGPNLGAINRAALIATDHVVTPLAPDLFSMEGLRSLGPTLAEWRASWNERVLRNPGSNLSLPAGRMRPLGYVVMQAAMRLSKPVQAYERGLARMPAEYHRSVLGDVAAGLTTATDPWCLGTMRHYQSLILLARDAQKPMFHLKPADGAIGARMDAVAQCRDDFEKLSGAMIARLAEVDEAR